MLSGEQDIPVSVIPRVDGGDCGDEMSGRRRRNERDPKDERDSLDETLQLLNTGNKKYRTFPYVNNRGDRFPYLIFFFEGSIALQ